MRIRLSGLVWGLITILASGVIGILLIGLSGGVFYLDDRPDLSVWHTTILDAEFTAASDVPTFEAYLALEDRLFQQLDEQIYAKLQPNERSAFNRYNRGSFSDPSGWNPNWNRSFELMAPSPQAGVLLLHGMSDSPYSLRQLGQRLHASGANVIGLRMPGHGTAPSGLVTLQWQDMTAAVRLAMRHLAKQSGDRPLYIVGYSTGAALAVQYVLARSEDPTLPSVSRLVLLSPAIGVSPAARLAVWQARLGHLLGMDKLAWNGILPEYDPFKYGSFAVNAADVVYQLTLQIQLGLDKWNKAGKLAELPPILAFSSIVDATVLTKNLVTGLFDRLPAGGHELVLFDLNRMERIESLMTADPSPVLEVLRANPERTFALSVITNRDPQTQAVIARRRAAGEDTETRAELNMSWPRGIYSLAHVALPFPPTDPIYGGTPDGGEGAGLKLGELALRGERGVLLIPPADMLRLRWNPFYAYVEQRTLQHLQLPE